MLTRIRFLRFVQMLALVLGGILVVMLTMISASRLVTWPLIGVTGVLVWVAIWDVNDRVKEWKRRRRDLHMKNQITTELYKRVFRNLLSSAPHTLRFVEALLDSKGLPVYSEVEMVRTSGECGVGIPFNAHMSILSDYGLIRSVMDRPKLYDWSKRVKTELHKLVEPMDPGFDPPIQEEGKIPSVWGMRIG